jgi:DNA-binding CsgD family transcriptional regulator
MTRLCAEDLDRWMTALDALPKDPLRLIDWLDRSVRLFFPFKRVLLVHAQLVAGEIRIDHLLSLGHTDEFVRDFPRRFDMRIRGCFSWWVKHRAPYCIDADAQPPFASVYELEQMRRYGSGFVAAHGVFNAAGSAGTFFSFALPHRPGEWTLDALRLIAPMLKDLFLRHLAATQSAVARLASLTPRQHDIVRLASHGMRSKAIARELELSDGTVRNQLSEIYSRLGVDSCREMLAAIR